MSGRPSETKGLWAISAVVAAVALALVLALFRAPRPPPPPAPRAEPGLGLGPPKGEAANPVYREEADLHDPTPLFLPTKWNSAQRLIPPRADQGVFAPSGPIFFFPERKLAVEDLDLPPSHRMPAGPAEALVDNPSSQPFLGFGRSDARLRPLPARGAFVEIVAVGTGRPVFSQALNDLPAGETDAPPNGGAWQFMAEVDDAGLVGTLVPTVRSGTDSDGFFLNYLAKTLRVGQRLGPGFYRISVGP